MVDMNIITFSHIPERIDIDTIDMIVYNIFRQKGYDVVEYSVRSLFSQFKQSKQSWYIRHIYDRKLVLYCKIIFGMQYKPK